MNKRSVRTTLCVGLFVLAVTQGVYASDEWQAYKGKERLTALFSNVKLHVELRDDVTATAEVRADKTATLNAWNAHFERTWKVADEEQVCFTGEDGTRCYIFC